MSNNIVKELSNYMNSRIVGQEKFVERLLLALFADGHILLEGAPGLAKTKAVNTLAAKIKCDARRIQFTPDLLPSDLTGTDIYHPEQQVHNTSNWLTEKLAKKQPQSTNEKAEEKSLFTFQPGPLFHNLVLADEINRAPAKVQSALLEAMAEKQVTVGGKTYPLPPLFMVLATQNPIEQEGTYPLPEAQLDRFLLQVNIDYPSAEAEREILKIIHNEATGKGDTVTDMIAIEDVFSARQEALKTHVSESLTEYIIQLIQATRYPEKYGSDLANTISFGASPRATIALERCARVYAWMQGEEFATPEHVQAIAHDVLRHRILLSFEAEADGKTTDQLIDELIIRVPVV